MKLAGRDAVRFFENPRRDCTALLIYGPDPLRCAHRRTQVATAILGPSGEEEMRLCRLVGGDLRKDPGLLLDSVRAQGFFPGPRVVLIDEVTDGLTKVFSPVLRDWQDGDAMIIATAGQLAARSSLRKLFEGDKRAIATGVYPDPPSRSEVEAMLAKAGVGPIDPDAMTDLAALASDLEPGDFTNTAEKIALFKYGDPSPVTQADVAACAPVTIEAALDDALNLIAEARVAEVAPLMHKLDGQGINPTSICIGATRHFRVLHLAASHPKGVEAGLSACRPPVFGPRRTRMARQSRALGIGRIEKALEILTDTDLGLRSTVSQPAQATLERAFIRIAKLAGS
ncbi:MAG: DNA polymerase III subunit delta [Paracoccaceae bacterium]